MITISNQSQPKISREQRSLSLDTSFTSLQDGVTSSGHAGGLRSRLAADMAHFFAVAIHCTLP